MRREKKHSTCSVPEAFGSLAFVPLVRANADPHEPQCRCDLADARQYGEDQDVCNEIAETIWLHFSLLDSLVG